MSLLCYVMLRYVVLSYIILYYIILYYIIIITLYYYTDILTLKETVNYSKSIMRRTIRQTKINMLLYKYVY